MFWNKKVNVDVIEEARKKAQIAYDLMWADLRSRGAKEMAEFEHTYHYAKEVKNVELARLDALIEAKKEILVTDEANYKIVLAEKDKVISGLLEAIANLSVKEK
jgi:hypothetical protein